MSLFVVEQVGHVLDALVLEKSMVQQLVPQQRLVHVLRPHLVVTTRVLNDLVDLVNFNQRRQSLLVRIKILFLQLVDLGSQVDILHVDVGFDLLQLSPDGSLEVIDQSLGQL